MLCLPLSLSGNYFNLYYLEKMVNLSKYLTNSPSETKKIGKILAQKIIERKWGKTALAIALQGGLGGGKTTFLQGFARGLGIKQKITSPTFVIIRKYKIQNTRHKIQNFYHLDCYRLGKPKEILDLRFKEVISNPENIVAIEWADRIRKIVPDDAIWIKFRFINKNIRKINIVLK